MRRRFQFSLRLVFALTALVAEGCAIWINLPIAARVAIGAAALGCLGWLVWPLGFSLWDFGLFGTDFLDRIARGRSSTKYVIKRRSAKSDQSEAHDES